MLNMFELLLPLILIALTSSLSYLERCSSALQRRMLPVLMMSQ